MLNRDPFDPGHAMVAAVDVAAADEDVVLLVVLFVK